MENTATSEMAVVFADVAGSVQLYDAIGDLSAHEKVMACLDSMAAIVERFDGRVVEIKGDELMSVFSKPDLAFEAASEIQRQLSRQTGSQLGVRIGFHFGPIARKDDHPYGDTVNVAARMVSKAKSGQIITNHQTRKYLARWNQARMHYVDRVYIKGKSDPYDLHEVVWDESESTVVLETHNIESMNRRSSDRSLCLAYADQQIKMTEASGELVVGRGSRSGLVVYSNAASRLHGVLSCQNGKMVYKDQSTNGTYIRTLKGKRFADGKETFIHYDEWVSDGSGMLSLGEPLVENDPNLVYFRIE